MAAVIVICVLIGVSAVACVVMVKSAKEDEASASSVANASAALKADASDEKFDDEKASDKYLYIYYNPMYMDSLGMWGNPFAPY